jgi:hypothetical protein
MSIIKPFQNETDSIMIDDLTIENRLDRIGISGSLQITRDKAGLQFAEDMKALIDATVDALQKDLQDHVSIRLAEKVKNPFDQQWNCIFFPKNKPGEHGLGRLER